MSYGRKNAVIVGSLLPRGVKNPDDVSHQNYGFGALASNTILLNTSTSITHLSACPELVHISQRVLTSVSEKVSDLPCGSGSLVLRTKRAVTLFNEVLASGQVKDVHLEE
jgi:hypothetical protein